VPGTLNLASSAKKQSYIDLCIHCIHVWLSICLWHGLYLCGPQRTTVHKMHSPLRAHIATVKITPFDTPICRQFPSLPSPKLERPDEEARTRILRLRTQAVLITEFYAMHLHNIAHSAATFSYKLANKNGEDTPLF
jgi:hypothetical protein